MSTLVWVAIPQRVDADGGLRLAIAVQPRLTGADVAASGMANWPPPALGATELAIDVAASPEAVPVTFPGAVQLAADGSLWPRLFEGTLRVDATLHAVPDERELVVARTASEARSVRQVFEAVSAVPIGPDGQGREAYAAAVNQAIAASDVGTGGGRRAEGVRRNGRGNLRGEPQPPAFHRKLALLREHPAVMRALGVVFDVVLAPGAALPHRGVLRVRWPDAPVGTIEIVSPWTRYELALERMRFLPASTAAISAGMLAIGDGGDVPTSPDRPVFSVTTLDVDLAVSRLQHSAGAARNGDATVNALPAMRSGGISILHHDRDREMGARRNRRDQRQMIDAAAMVLDADDLVLGFRVDVRRGDGGWQSLCVRRATYEIDGLPVGAANALEEGNLKSRAAVEDGDGKVLHTDEIVARWQGWSLALPRPRLDGMPPPGLPRNRPSAGSDMTWRFAAPPGSLPALRFGAKYQLRVRIADIAGGGLGVDDLLADRCATDSVVYERYEPIVSPGIALPGGVDTSALGPGEAVDEIVLRSDRDLTPAAFAAAHPAFGVHANRLLFPPRVPLALVEQHAMLDGLGAAAAWDLIRDAVAPEAPTFPEPLPDPAAEGLSAFHAPMLGAVSGQPRTRAWPAWPSIRPKRVRLVAGRRGEVPVMRWTVAGDVDELLLTLAPGHALVVELGSTMREDFPDRFAAGQFLLADAKRAALNGRHPLLTPSALLRCVHAVRRPLADPAGSLRAERKAGSTRTTLEPVPALLGVDAPSTARVELRARWLDHLDDVTLERAAEVGATTLSPEAIRLDAPLVHEFGDTRHRLVTYDVTAISRHRHFFDEHGDVDDDAFTARTRFPAIHVPSSAAPMTPVVLDVVPAFRWVTEPPDDAAVIVQRRRKALLRVVLGRPWFSSGAGEQLAVLTAASATVPSTLWSSVSEVSRDPLWITGGVERWPDFAKFAGASDPVHGLHVAALGQPLDLVPHDVFFAGGSWHADVALTIGEGSYAPLVRLALARYQPHSLDGLALSPIVQGPFATLLPERVLRVSMVGNVLRVRLDGLGPAGPMPNRVEAALQVCAPGVAASADLVAIDGEESASALWKPMADATATARGGLGDTLVLTIPKAAGEKRVVVREVEQIPAAPPLAGMPVQSTPSLTERVTFLDIVRIPASAARA